MTRKHRQINVVTGVETSTPYTADEEAAATAYEVTYAAKAAERAAQKIMVSRRKGYPAPRAEADVLWHYIKWMKVNKSADYATLPLEVTDWFDQCEQVKINNPKT
jgi:hypothetical protein